MNNFNENLQKLQDYPHIQEFIEKYYDDPELLGLFCAKLLRDTREDTRKGFSEDIAEALLFFSTLNLPNMELSDYDYEKPR